MLRAFPVRQKEAPVLQHELHSNCAQASLHMRLIIARSKSRIFLSVPNLLRVYRLHFHIVPKPEQFLGLTNGKTAHFMVELTG